MGSEKAIHLPPILYHTLEKINFHMDNLQSVLEIMDPRLLKELNESPNGLQHELMKLSKKIFTTIEHSQLNPETPESVEKKEELYVRLKSSTSSFCGTRFTDHSIVDNQFVKTPVIDITYTQGSLDHRVSIHEVNVSHETDTSLKSSTKTVSESLLAGSTAPTDDVNKKLTKHLRHIEMSKILINKEEKQKCMKIVEDSVAALIGAMKRADPLFEDLFQKKIYTGSSHEGLRIRSATEFDQNLVLRLPFKRDDVTLYHPDATAGFLQFKLKQQLECLLSHNKQKWHGLHENLKDFFKGDCLDHGNVKKWIKGVVDKAMPLLKLPEFIKDARRKESGPAITWCIKAKDVEEIAVDLVVVIDGSEYDFPSDYSEQNRFQNLEKVYKTWYLVPKPPKSQEDGKMLTSQYWRVSFPEAEKELLKDMRAVKPLIRILKLLRDQRKWEFLASYYIKTLFLWQLEEHPERNFWSDDNLGSLFLKMLNELKKVIFIQNLPSYHFKEHNLLNKLKKDTCGNVTNAIDKIIKQLQRDPARIFKMLGMFDPVQDPETDESSPVTMKLALGR